jgi:hypothetical protein
MTLLDMEETLTAQVAELKAAGCAAQGRLRRRAPTQPVTRPCRLPASGPIDNYPDETLPH